jgi:hypothetical protein
MKKLAMAVGVLLLAQPPLLFTLYLFHVDVIEYLARSLILGMAFALPLLGVAALVAAVVVAGMGITKIIKAS